MAMDFNDRRNQKKLMKAVDMLKAMSNPSRLGILCQLCGGEMSVGEIAKNIDLSQSALSQHLAKLRDQKLVKTRREQQMIYYSLDSEEVEAIIGALYSLYCETGKR